MGVTSIDIDYYEELKAKADEYDFNKYLIEIGKATIKAFPNQGEFYINKGMTFYSIEELLEWAESEDK